MAGGTKIGNAWFDGSWANLKKVDFIRVYGETPQAVATGVTAEAAWLKIKGKKATSEETSKD